MFGKNWNQCSSITGMGVRARLESVFDLDWNTHLERKASDQLGAQVKFDQDSDPKSGWMKIRYYDLDTLEGVLTKLGIIDE